jgi:hypothetical protein
MRRVSFALLAAVVACGSQSSGTTPTSPGEPSPPAAAPTAPNPPAAAPTPPAVQPPSGNEHWVYEAPSYGAFVSTKPGDLWSGLSHHVDGVWRWPIGVPGNLAAPVSDQEIWSTDYKNTLYRTTPAGQTQMDLPRTVTRVNAIASGWIGYESSDHYGLIRPNGATFDDYPITANRAVADVYRDMAITGNGGILSFDGFRWNATASPSGPSFEKLTGSGPNDLFGVGWPSSGYFDGTAWTDLGIADKKPMDV